MPELPPYLLFYLGALLVLVLRGPWQAILTLAVPVASATWLLQLEAGMSWQFQLFDMTLTPMRVDKLSLLFAYLFHLAALIGAIYALRERDTLLRVAALAYAGSAVGAVFAGDLLTLFVFWEGLALSSVFLVWARRTPEAYRAGMRYLLLQVGSGVLLLIGALAWQAETGSLDFGHIGATSTAGWIILLAFGIKAAFPGLHTWLTDAYPQASAAGTVYLSAFTTKVAVYALARGYAGTDLLIYIGAVMTCFPIFYAVIENDLRRVLGYSMINQIGFMVVGVGLGTELALNGAVAHAFNDVIFKGLLFMSMGAVLYRVGHVDGSHLGGLFRTMPKTAGLCIVGAASISAFPLFSGFVSKSMVMSAALLEGQDWVWLALLFASAGVFHHAGIKIPFFAFFAHDSGLRPREAPLNMLLAMGLAAVLCVAIGSFPRYLYALLPYDTGYSPFDAGHVLAQTQLLFYSALAFVWLKLAGLYPPELPSVNLDSDWTWRRALPALGRGLQALDQGAQRLGATLLELLRQPLLRILAMHRHPHGILARSHPTSSMVFWVTVLLAITLIYYNL